MLNECKYDILIEVRTLFLYIIRKLVLIVDAIISLYVLNN